MRDPWLPVALIGIVLLGVWLGIGGPLPDGLKTIHEWQTLIGACVAIAAASIALRNVRTTERLETHRRHRKHAAVRAVLPLALSQVQDYAEQSARALDDLTKNGQSIIAFDRIGEPLSPDTLKVLAEFIEYAEDINVVIMESTVAWIQIHESRLRRLVRRKIIFRADAETNIVDAAIIYAGASAFFAYARRRSQAPPATFKWVDAAIALRDMGFREEKYPGIHQMIERRASEAIGPLGRSG